MKVEAMQALAASRNKIMVSRNTLMVENRFLRKHIAELEGLLREAIVSLGLPQHSGRLDTANKLRKALEND